MPLSQRGDEVHAVPQSLKGSIRAVETLLAKAGQTVTQSSCIRALAQLSLHFQTPTRTCPSPLTFFLGGLLVTVTCHTPLSTSSVYNIHGQSQVALPLRELQVPTLSSPYYVGPIHVLCTSSKWCLTSKASMQGLQKGLAPPDHCRQKIGKKGEIFPPTGSACVKTGERGKGKYDLHGAISDCPS